MGKLVDVCILSTHIRGCLSPVTNYSANRRLPTQTSLENLPVNATAEVKPALVGLSYCGGKRLLNVAAQAATTTTTLTITPYIYIQSFVIIPS